VPVSGQDRSQFRNSYNLLGIPHISLYDSGVSDG
jgi:hypothetical protein